MSRLSSLTTGLLVRASEMTNRTFVLPLLIFYPTSRCNSRCVSCDWWRATGEDDLALAEIEPLADAVAELRTRTVAFSGGEPLLRSDWPAVAALFRTRQAKLHLLTSGLLLARHADEAAALFDRITVSLDGSTPESYRAVRGVDGLATIEAGIARVRARAPRIPITVRATLHARNFHEMPELVARAKAWRVDGISFLAADVSSGAFGRRDGLGPRQLLLDEDQIGQFDETVAETERLYPRELASGFIAESAAKLRRLPQYYAAMRTGCGFPAVSCNAPWASVVVEANGTVRPCFFHQPIGNVRRKSLVEIVRDDLPLFRQTLDIEHDPVCQRCVCSLKAGVGNHPWS